jgi:excisionase family DNA binding protein
MSLRKEGPMEKYLTAKEAADKLRVSERTLIRWEKSGALKPKRIGGVKRYKASELDK